MKESESTEQRTGASGLRALKIADAPVRNWSSNSFAKKELMRQVYTIMAYLTTSPFRIKVDRIFSMVQTLL